METAIWAECLYNNPKFCLALSHNLYETWCKMFRELGPYLTLFCKVILNNMGEVFSQSVPFKRHHITNKFWDRE